MLGAVLLVELFAAVLLIASHPTRPAAESVVVAGRTVELIDLDGDRGRPLLDRARADIGAAIGAVETFWGSDWQPDVVIVATGSRQQFIREAHLDPNGQWADIAAVSVADEVDLAAGRATGQRIVLAPGAAAMSDTALRIVLAHELFHLAARTRTALDAPRWLTEGVADFVARPAAPIPPGAAAATAIPTDAELDGPARSAGYDRAWWFARFVADEYGDDGLRRLYDRACGPGHGDFAEAVRAALGTGVAELQTRWARWLAARTG